MGVSWLRRYCCDVITGLLPEGSLSEQNKNWFCKPSGPLPGVLPGVNSPRAPHCREPCAVLTEPCVCVGGILQPNVGKRRGFGRLHTIYQTTGPILYFKHDYHKLRRQAIKIFYTTSSDDNTVHKNSSRVLFLTICHGWIAPWKVNYQRKTKPTDWHGSYLAYLRHLPNFCNHMPDQGNPRPQS